MGGKYIHYCIVCGPTILVLFGVIIRTGSSSSTSTSNFSYLEISLSEASGKFSLRADESNGKESKIIFNVLNTVCKEKDL